MICPFDKYAIVEMLMKRRWHWIKCPLCFGNTTFEHSDDLFLFQRRGYCRCGYRFTDKMETGLFPSYKVLIWDEVAV